MMSWLACLVASMLAFADEFDRLEGPALVGVATSADAESKESLSVAELGGLPNVLAGTRTPVIVVKTDEGNYARLLIAPALRKAPQGKDELLPILVVERFDTFESGAATHRLATGRNLILFDGFRLDLDSGQVVPEGQGGDIQFVGAGGAKLVVAKPARLFTLTKSPLPPSAGAARRTPGRGVVPADFGGIYRIFANGQASGRLELKVDDAGLVTGRLRSDQTGGSYKVTGDVGKDSPNRIRFNVDLPRTRQEFDGLIFLEGKGAIAGSYVMLDRTFGFFAIREGGTVAPDGVELGSRELGDEGRGALSLDVSAEAVSREGKPLDDAGLRSAVKSALELQPANRIQLRVSSDVRADRLMQLIDLIRDAGATRIRLLPESPR